MRVLCIYVTYHKIEGYSTCYFKLFCMCVPPDVLCQGTRTTFCDVVMLSPIMMSHTNTYDVTYDAITTS